MKTRASNTGRMIATGAVALACVASVAPSAGCRGDRTGKPPRQFFPDMDDQAKYKAQAESTFFADGRTMREPPRGTMPFGSTSVMGWGGSEQEQAQAASWVSRDRADLLRADDAFYLGQNPDGSWVDVIPVAVDRDLLERGRERYNIYCIVCHGAVGDGKGTVGLSWAYDLPTWHQDQYRRGGEKGQDGYLFHVIRNGVANAPGVQPPLKMPSYASQVSERDAWAIVGYLRALQEARSVPVREAPEIYRQELERTRGASGPAASAAGTETMR